MLITLKGEHRRRFRSDLMEHRRRSSLNDADYVRRTLKISLNTYKRCIGPTPSLELKRLTFNAVVANAGLDPARYGHEVAVGTAPANLGGYSKAEFGFLASRFFLYRRSFLTGRNITRSVLDLAWDDSVSCLTYREQLHYTSDSGIAQAIVFSGHVHIHAERAMLGLPYNGDGELRLTLLHMPTRRTSASTNMPMRAAGVVLTHGYPKRVYQPVVSAVAIEEAPARGRTQSVEALCRTLKPGMPEYDPAEKDLLMAEEHAVVMTPLLARGLAK